MKKDQEIKTYDPMGHPMDVITENFIIINRVIDRELYNVDFGTREDLKQDVLFKLCKIANRESIAYIKALTKIVARSSICDYYRHKKVVYAITPPPSNSFNLEDVGASNIEYELVELQTDYKVNRNKFSKCDKKILDLILLKEVSSCDVVGMIGVHRTTVYRAIRKLRCLYSPPTKNSV